MRTIIALSLTTALLLVGGAATATASETAQDPFQPTWESLKQYKCPDWFRDAKFGIWAHWGPQAVPMVGDWYARKMYMPEDPVYAYHLKTFGHPSEFGYKDIIPQWKAEKWDPDRLMALYKKGGARYFVSMGVHHDNFDLWNSKHHRWNATAMGPKRDVVGDWQKAAKKQGLPFGVSEHLGASFTWFQTSRGADKAGPKAGVPYDGADPKYQDLYHPAVAKGDNGWYSTDPAAAKEWSRRIGDLADQYHPDLLYTDGAVPFGETGRRMLAHLYNTGIRQPGGQPEVVYTCKNMPSNVNYGEFVPGAVVQDMERGVLAGINPLPWQTDTSIADWFYNRNWKYRNADWVIKTLVDVVSKNGNLLLNVVQRPDGSLDPEVEQLLKEMGDWVAINGEAIYGTRPWRVFGEGDVKTEGGHFKEDFAYTCKDIRFTTKGKDTLYAIALGWPAGRKLVVRSLAKGSPQATDEISDVRLLGHEGELEWSRTADGLAVVLPEKKPCEHAFVIKIGITP
jgi:alpha-L-fucosidase